MKKNTFLANVIVWATLSVACIAFLIWAAAQGGDLGESTFLLALSIFSRPVGAFSIAALITTVVVRKVDLKLSHGVRIAWRVLGIVPVALFMLSPFAIPMLPKEAATVFAAVLLLAMAVPVLYVLFGVFYGLSLCGEKPSVDDRADVRPDRI